MFIERLFCLSKVFPENQEAQLYEEQQDHPATSCSWIPACRWRASSQPAHHRSLQQRLSKSDPRLLGADVSISSITHQNIETFLDSFQNITNTTILHYYSALAALWTWALKEEIVSVHIVHKIRPPRPEKREIVPFNEAEIKAMLSVVARSKAYERPGKRKSDHALGTADRNRAILLMLVDTGLRASELCELQLNQLDHRNNRVQVLGKGSLERSVPFSPRTAQAIWRYLTSRPDARPDDPVFVTSLGRPLDRNQLRKQLGDYRKASKPA